MFGFLFRFGFGFGGFFGISDAAMVDGTHGFGDGGFDLMQFLQRQITFVELAIHEALAAHLGDEFLDACGGGFAQGASGRFDAIAEHHDGGFGCLRFGAWVSEFKFGGRGVVGLFAFLFGGVIKIFDERGAVMGFDEMSNGRGQVVFAGHFDAVFDVADDDEHAHGGAEFVVFVGATGLVFHEILGLIHLADVVEHGTDAAEHGRATDGFGGGFGHVRQAQRMLVSTRRELGEALQQRMGHVVEILERHQCCDFERGLDGRQCGLHDESGGDARAERPQCVVGDELELFGHVERSAGQPSEPGRGGHGEAGPPTDPDEFGSAADFVELNDGDDDACGEDEAELDGKFETDENERGVDATDRECEALVVSDSEDDARGEGGKGGEEIQRVRLGRGGEDRECLHGQEQRGEREAAHGVVSNARFVGECVSPQANAEDEDQPGAACLCHDGAKRTDGFLIGLLLAIDQLHVERGKFLARGDQHIVGLIRHLYLFDGRGSSAACGLRGLRIVQIGGLGIVGDDGEDGVPQCLGIGVEQFDDVVLQGFEVFFIADIDQVLIVTILRCARGMGDGDLVAGGLVLIIFDACTVTGNHSDRRVVVNEFVSRFGPALAALSLDEFFDGLECVFVESQTLASLFANLCEFDNRFVGTISADGFQFLAQLCQVSGVRSIDGGRHLLGIFAALESFGFIDRCELHPRDQRGGENLAFFKAMTFAGEHGNEAGDRGKDNDVDQSPAQAWLPQALPQAWRGTVAAHVTTDLASSCGGADFVFCRRWHQHAFPANGVALALVLVSVVCPCDANAYASDNRFAARFNGVLSQGSSWGSGRGIRLGGRGWDDGSRVGNGCSWDRGIGLSIFALDALLTAMFTAMFTVVFAVVLRVNGSKNMGRCASLAKRGQAAVLAVRVCLAVLICLARLIRRILLIIIRSDNALDQIMADNVGFSERDPGHARHALQSSSRIDQARVVGDVEIDLRGVAGDDHFAAVPEAREEHEHLRANGVLRFIEDDDGIIECSATHERERRDLNDVAGQKTLDLIVFHAVVQCVEQGAKVGVDFLLQIAGQESQFFTGFNGRTNEYELAHFFGFQKRHGGSHREIRFAGARRTDAESQVVFEHGLHVIALAIGAGANASATQIDIEAVA